MHRRRQSRRRATDFTKCSLTRRAKQWQYATIAVHGLSRLTRSNLATADPMDRRWIRSASSMNLRRALQRGLELLEREVGAAGNLEDRHLAAAAELGGIGKFRGDVDRDHDRTMAVGMDEVVGLH